MKTRFDQLVSALGITITEFGREIGGSNSTVRNGLKGPKGPTADLFAKIFARYPNVNLHWLITGEGDMFLHQSDRGQQFILEETSNPYQSQMLEMMQEQNEFLKQQVEHWRQQCERWQAEYDKCKGELQGKYK